MSKRDGSKLLNYTSEIEPIKSAGEIMGILAAKGAQSVMIDYRNGEPVGLAFKIEVSGVGVGFRLPCDVDGAHRALSRNPSIPPRYKNPEQAKRTAWRLLKTWVEVQMAMIECGQAETAQVFMPYAVVGVSGQTMFQLWQEDPRRMLTTGESEESNVVEGRFSG